MGGLNRQSNFLTSTATRRLVVIGFLFPVLWFLPGCEKIQNAPATTPAQKTALPRTAESNPPTDPIQINPAEPQPKPKAEPVYRPADTRRVLTKAELTQFGLNSVESKHLRIYSDLPLEEIESLPAIIDQAYEAWVKYFGLLPENRQGSDFQITGYLMSNVQHFRDAGLIPPVFSDIGNGRHQGAEFWMPVPKPGYYRRHLLLHEATHCYMMYLPRISAPVWYLEGMAELFATHQQTESGTFQFRVFPDHSENFPLLGRIELIERNIEKSGLKNLTQLEQLEATGFQNVNSYAWAWAICAFFDQHPRYQDRFQQMGRDFLLEEPFNPLIKRIFGNELAQINQEWLSFASELEYGMDLSQFVVNFQPGVPLENDQTASCEIDSRQYWQSTQWMVEEGQTYLLQAEGQFALAEEPKPWISEANGISFEYHQGLPLGRLIGAIIPLDDSASEGPFSQHDHCFTQLAKFGNETTFKAPYSGTLYLRLNDSPTQLHDNQGSVSVTLIQVEP